MVSPTRIPLSTPRANIVQRAFYTALSMYNSLGMTLTPDSMLHFADASFPLLVSTALSYAGNPFYPVFLRFVIWLTTKCLPRSHRWQEALEYLLNNPRRCYLLLFPAKHTWWLLGITLGLNTLEAGATFVCDRKKQVLSEFAVGADGIESLPMWNRALASWYQAVNTRHTGSTVLK